MTAIFSTLTKQVPDTLERGDRWREQALCANDAYDPETWFPVGESPAAQQQTADAKAVCYQCPVIDACLRWATETRQDNGVWGGLSEKERTSLRRRKARAAAPKPAATPVFETYRSAYDSLTLAVDGHIKWTGANEVRINGTRRSPNQVAWRATRDRAPVGQVLADCDHDGCVQHLTDQTIRDQRARQWAEQAALKPMKCGTVNGYKAHRNRGETACPACQQAKTDEVRSLRNTGTTKPLTERSAA
ncbi:WhiB family transcriptional regulator [Streptomyces sp. NPDC006978]|uniref:WhiB family transcriptional regulator n=1 Tax=Streptomyces sp. NPDC006978 TaxID=3364769 RepID=UPI0036AB90B7